MQTLPWDGPKVGGGVAFGPSFAAVAPCHSRARGRPTSLILRGLLYCAFFGASKIFAIYEIAIMVYTYFDSKSYAAPFRKIFFFFFFCHIREMLYVYSVSLAQVV